MHAAELSSHFRTKGTSGRGSSRDAPQKLAQVIDDLDFQMEELAEFTCFVSTERFTAFKSIFPIE